MPENLLCPKQKGTTPPFREGWDKTFNTIRVMKTRIPDMKEILEHEQYLHKSVGYRVVVEREIITEIGRIEERP